MVTAFDTNIFLDITDGPQVDATSTRLALKLAARHGPLVVSVVALAELSPRFTTRSARYSFLASFDVEVSNIDEEVAFLAGQFFKQYRLRGGTRTRILADFLIAAHAQLRADRLLTRDDRFFKDSFPGLVAVHPRDL